MGSVKGWMYYMGGDRRRGRGHLGVNLGCPIVANGDLMRSCVEVREPIELSFGVVSGHCPGIDVLDCGLRASSGRSCFRDFFGICAPICLNGQNDVFFAEKCIRLVGKKLTIFPYGQDIVVNVSLLAFCK